MARIKIWRKTWRDVWPAEPLYEVEFNPSDDDIMIQFYEDDIPGEPDLHPDRIWKL
jgi:hypothetical protein